MNTKISPYTRSLNIALAAVEEIGAFQRELQRSDGSQDNAFLEKVLGTTRDRLLEGIADIFPDDAFYLQEEQVRGDDTTCYRRWIVDPLDGEIAYLKRHSGYAISIVLQERGYNDQFETVLGIVHAPALEDTYCAIRGEGSWYNGRPFNPNEAEGGAEYQDKMGSISLDIITSGLDEEGQTPKRGKAAELILSEALEWEESETLPAVAFATIDAVE